MTPVCEQHCYADGDDQRAAAPIARYDETERDDEDEPHDQDRPLTAQDFPKELPDGHNAASARSTTLVNKKARVRGPTPPG
ncbi:MAG: hypothetical protein G01um1014106_232, partial [Parcubacteria group bacterium Gr01-1014_106]